MTSTATQLRPRPPLLELLDSQFSRVELSRRLGPGLPEVDVGHFQAALCDPLRDFLSRPGKEFRARLVQICWHLAGGQGPVPERLGNIVEVLHAGSLIVDDIEDESATRRGRPALHVTYGVPVALNAGNWLYFLAYGLVEQLGLGPHVELSLYRWLSRTMTRCHEGQALDLTVCMGRLSQAEVPAVVETVTRLKTGALMGLSSVMAAVAAGAPNRTANAFLAFGEHLGVGLQMLDDLGCLTSQRRCHKGHEDLIHGRPTWPWAWLSRDLHEIDYLRLQQKAREVETRDRHPELLAEEMRGLLGPECKGRVWQHLARAQRMLPHDLPGASGVQELQRELERLMRSYD